MDDAIHFLNVEIGVFLRYLRCFSVIDNVQISQQTVDLMNDAMRHMNKLSKKARVIENTTRNDMDFLFQLDEHTFELQRNVLCRTCYEQFPVTKDDFTAHVRTKHQAPLSLEFATDLEPTSRRTSKGTSSPNTSNGSSYTSFDQGFVDDNSFAHSIEDKQPKYSDIVRKNVQSSNSEVVGKPKVHASNAKPIDITLIFGDYLRTDHCFEAITCQMTELLARTSYPVEGESDVLPTKAAKIINEFIALKPICRNLIGYVRAWQKVVNEVAMQNRRRVFQFDAYIISVLVIFFLQVDYDLPTVNDFQSAGAEVKRKCKAFDDQKHFSQILFEFFHFYGTRYEINNHLISARIGRWQEQRLAGQQKYFSSEQKSLRDGMKSNPENWQKCTMFVQDLVEPGLNITARVSKEDAHNFQALCQMFSISCRSKLTNETKPNTSQTMPQRKSVSLNNLHGIKLSVNRDKSSKSGQLMASTQSAAKKKKPTQNPIFIIDEAIKNKEIFEIIHCELSKVSSRSDARMRSESKILGLLKHHFKMFDRSLAIVPFGSTTYGFGGGQSNYNIFVDTRKSQQVQVLEAFEKYAAKSDVKYHFDKVAEIPNTRPLKQQLRLIHIESGIHVLLLADDIAIAETSKLIRDFIAIKPICQNMIECIIAWQTALNSVLAESGKVAFQFNTYLISILVIFFMQMNYDVPTIEGLAPKRSSVEAMKKAGASLEKDLQIVDKLLSEFFRFYGQRYQIGNHVISLNIGRWQERRIQGEQKFFLPNQKRLRDGMSSNPANWKNCTMYVEDLLRPGINVAAEIPAKDAYNFQHACLVFTKKDICQHMCHK